MPGELVTVRTLDVWGPWSFWGGGRGNVFCHATQARRRTDQLSPAVPGAGVRRVARSRRSAESVCLQQQRHQRFVARRLRLAGCEGATALDAEEHLASPAGVP